MFDVPPGFSPTISLVQASIILNRYMTKCLKVIVLTPPPPEGGGWC